MEKDLKLRLATDIVMYHLERRPTHHGSGFFIGTIEDMQRFADRMSLDMTSANLLCKDNFKRVHGKDLTPLVSKMVFNCLGVFAQKGRNSWSSFFIHKDKEKDLRQRIMVDLDAGCTVECHSYYTTQFLLMLLATKSPE